MNNYSKQIPEKLIHEINAAEKINVILKQNAKDFDLTEKDILFFALNNSGYFSEESQKQALDKISPLELLKKIEPFSVGISI